MRKRPPPFCAPHPPNEIRFGESLKLPNYRIFLINKYTAEIRTLDGDYDLIVDNNPSGFACCRYHFHYMLESYLGLLRGRGEILTDRGGLRWQYRARQDGGLDFDDLVDLSSRFPVTVSRITRDVFSVKLGDRPGARQPRLDA